MKFIAGMRFLLLSCILACSWSGLGAQKDLRVLNEWAVLDFQFPSEEAKANATANRFYVPGNSIPIDVDVQFRKDQEPRYFITIPRFGDGRPVTLGTVDESGLIAAYPDWSWNDNQGSNCDKFTSVFRVAQDKCNRLWVMDNGKIGNTRYCPPQLLAFDLTTDELVYRHVVDSSSYVDTSNFVTPVIDAQGEDCSDMFVYVADNNGFGILTIDVAKNTSWRKSHRTVFPYPSNGTFTIEGESFDLMDGILGMAVAPASSTKEAELYFHALSSIKENVISTSVLRDESALGNPFFDPSSVTVLSGERPNQSAAEAFDRNGILYFGLMDPPSVYCWNKATEFSSENIHPLAVNRTTLQFASGLKVVDNLNGEQELFVMTCRFQKNMAGTLNSNELNFRISGEKLDVLLEDSPCKLN